jgi:sulfoxide reductase heme-binding subunit YedZ
MVLLEKFKAHWLQILTHAGALWPLAQLVWDHWQNSFIVDPVRETMTRTGHAALGLLLLSLACTPIHTLFGFKQVLRVRRALGLYAFMYAGWHFLTFIGLDYRFDFELIVPAIFDQRFVLVGFVAFLLLLPLAVTSTRSWQKRLGKNWKRLHRLVYLAGVLVVLHYLWLVKDINKPVRYGAVLGLLLMLRIPPIRKAAKKIRRTLEKRRKTAREV